MSFEMGEEGENRRCQKKTPFQWFEASLDDEKNLP
jgi:hypothetical protein